MQITSEFHGEVLEMRVVGRLDNDGAGHLTTAIDEAVRLGSHSIVLDLEQTNYISSAGIGALVKAHKQFQAIRGQFGVVAVSKDVAEIIRLTGLSKMLLCDRAKLRGSITTSSGTMQPTFRVSAQAGMTYELYDAKPDGEFTCEVFGSPAPLMHDRFQSSNCRPVQFGAGTLGLGLGAFGSGFDDCANRFGEFLSVGGATAQQTTEASGKPDFQRSIGDFVPQVQTLYGMQCRGDFSQLVRFDRVDEESRLTLSTLVKQFLDLCETDLAAMVFLAESAGLIGASLRRSPGTFHDASISRMSHPEIRRWLSFTADRSFLHSQTLVVGIAARGTIAANANALSPLLRPLDSRSELSGHFHAAAFSYRPFKKRRLDLNEVVSSLFETEDLQGVMHLLNDDREITGGGESEFVRGACWIGPISKVVEQGN